MKVQGLCDGEKVVLSEPLPLAPNTVVEIVIPDTSHSSETAYWQELVARGLILSMPPEALAWEKNFTPVPIEGGPVSQTIIEHRR